MNKINFKTAVYTCLNKKYADFSGRATRSEFFYFLLFSIIFLYLFGGIIGLISVGMVTLFEGNSTLYIISSKVYEFTLFAPGTIIIATVLLPIILPLMAVTTRRLNDFNKPGWVQILFYGGFFLAELIYWPNMLPTFILIIFYLYYFSRTSIE